MSDYQYNDHIHSGGNFSTHLAAFILLFLCSFEECEIVSCQCKPNVNIDFYLLSFFYSNGKFQENCERVKVPDDCTIGFISGKKTKL